jgi:hypothetical protein
MVAAISISYDDDDDLGLDLYDEDDLGLDLGYRTSSVLT